MKKRRGFTLVELIGALAILSIGLTGIVTAFSASAQARKNEDVRLSTAANAQIISETFRGKGKVFIEDVYNGYANKTMGADGKNSIYLYTFFDDNSDLKQNLDNQNFVQVTNGTGGYNDCSSVNNSHGNLKFGAKIQITDDTNGYALYRINVVVWNLKYGEVPNTKLTFYLGS